MNWLRRLWEVLWFTPPRGETLQERYPAAPGVPTFTYSSVHLPDDAFAPGPRSMHPCPWCGTDGAYLKAYVPDVTLVLQCRHPDCQKLSKVLDLTDTGGFA